MEKKPEEIIQKLCGPVEKRIEACADLQVAQFLKERLCSELQQNCNSEIVINFLNKYVDGLIKHKFYN